MKLPLSQKLAEAQALAIKHAAALVGGSITALTQGEAREAFAAKMTELGFPDQSRGLPFAASKHLLTKPTAPVTRAPGVSLPEHSKRKAEAITLESASAKLRATLDVAKAMPAVAAVTAPAVSMLDRLANMPQGDRLSLYVQATRDLSSEIWQAISGSELNRDEFFMLPPAQQLAFSREGGRLTDGPSKAAKGLQIALEVAAPTPTNAATRAVFDAMSPEEQLAHCKAGNPITD